MIVERDVVDAVPGGRLLVPRGAVVTPLARDAAAERGVELVREASDAAVPRRRARLVRPAGLGRSAAVSDLLEIVDRRLAGRGAYVASTRSARWRASSC